MSRPAPPIYKTRNWPTYSEALKRRGSLTVRFDPEMNRDDIPSGRRGRQQTYSAAIQTCLTMKGEGRLGSDPVDRFNPERAEPRALRCGAVADNRICESLLRLIGSIGWCRTSAPCVAARRPRAMNIPYRDSQGPPPLLIDSTGIEVEAKASGTRASTAAPNDGSGARSARELMRVRRIVPPAGPRKSSPCCRNCSARSRPSRRSPA